MKETLSEWLPTLIKEVELSNPEAMGILGYMYEKCFLLLIAF